METARKNYKDRSSKLRVRSNKAAMSAVASVRITEKEKEEINEVMKNLNIKRYSDFMRIALQMVQPDMSCSQVNMP